ncbi:alpha-1,3-mannosyltransferase ALG2 [Mucor circinelloides 1006PhL]|uniref:Alpha-1,3/1,6-mannosyltransferase ALG2 n=1 Tax=Mucor circinelloides f. circinelloides (strain 1006PhL) TaxID=1220926 RepID=S2J6Q8_MUCC1|nr:alpha-1,3-mannosyltransferase ALG2 [Mucor circinelloides 1006PhL]
MSEENAKLNIAFIHPDLGIGGAERLVVDAAVGIQSKGHRVTMYTSHHDRNHCFEETRDGTLEVRVRGDSLPRDVFGRLYIICAILRQLALVMWILKFERDTYDIIFVDQLSACVPILKWFSSSRILFYCHFPDKLLTKRDSKLKELYRVPIDKLEEWSTGMADTITVNSHFTAGMFKRSFPGILKVPRVLYPPINFAAYDKQVDLADPSVQIIESHKKTIVSINRFEKKKNVELALRAFALLRKDDMISQEEFSEYRLVLAGGYDKRVVENVEYLKELDALATKTFGLETFTLFPSSTEKPPTSAQIIFLCSFNDAQRTYLLDQSMLLLYTPSNEHFGITPVEGMYASLPVIAANSGGPLETVKDKETGLILAPEPELWAKGIRDFINHTYNGTAMGKVGRQHVKNKFSLEAFADQLEDILEELTTGGRPTRWEYDNLEYGMRIIVAISIFICWYKFW